MEPNESMNRSRHEPQRNRTGTNHFAVHKVIFEPMRIDANHGNPVTITIKGCKVKLIDYSLELPRTILRVLGLGLPRSFHV